MMKRLKFSEKLVPLVVGCEKDTTWRINDDKMLGVGDGLSLCYNDGREFGKAVVMWVKETTFESLTDEDKVDHEKFVSSEEMYSTYSEYYGFEVTPKTRLKVVKFKLV